MTIETTAGALAGQGFSDVDASGQAAEHASYLDRVGRLAAEAREGWLDRLALTEGDIVLDAGCGVGDVALQLAERVGSTGRAVGIDLSAELIERAGAKAVGVGNVEYRAADLTDVPFGDDSFDAAFSERVFLHLADPQRAMDELHRVLRPGGRLVIVDPDNTRVATDADDSDLADLLASRFGLLAANSRSGRHLRSQAVLAGFAEVVCEPFARAVTDRDVARTIAIQPVEDRVAALVAEGLVTHERGQAFLADQDRREAEGRFQITTLWYLLAARKAVDR